MKRTISQTAAILAATTFAAQISFADLAGSLKGSSGQVADASQATLNIVAGVVTITSESTMVISEKSSEAMASAANGVSDISQKAFASAKGIVVKGFAISKNTSTMVLDFSKAHPLLSAGSAVLVSAVTAGGGLIPASMTQAGDALVVSVKTTSNAASTVLDASGKVVVGTVKWASNTSAAAGKFLMNSAGELLDASGKVVGWVVDASGDVLKLAVNASGKLTTVIGDGSEVIITGSADALKSTAAAISTVANATGGLVSDAFEASMKVSKLGSLVVVTVSEKATGSITGSIRFTSQMISNLFDSMASKQSQH